MASSFSSLPLPSTEQQNHYTFEVFLSFRGKDTRFSFTDHLYAALHRRGIKTFRDNEELNRGEDISQELLKAIQGSRVSIIVFSETYASSRWCLDELVQILECRRSKGQEVRPVFYKVDPSDVRNQTGVFGDGFAELYQSRYEDKICKWKKALKEAADSSGWHYQDGQYETEFIDGIVGELSARVINPSCMLHVAAHPIGLESCREAVNRLLDLEEIVVRMVGIWGAGGIGKTTIAKDVFNSIRHKFEGSCFLADVRSNSNGLAKLQETLLSRILGGSNLKINTVDEGVRLIEERMKHKKILIILDDVSHSSQLQNLVPSRDCFGRGSRILVTTRDKRLLIEVDEVYEVEMLNDSQAMNLFSLNAFRTIAPPSDHLELAQRAIRYAQGLPLALIDLGSHLYCRSKEEWEATIGSCRADPHADIQGVLMLSYDALGEGLKEVFLDIACFFKGKYVDDVKPILQACYDLNPGSGIKQLQEKALLRIDKDEVSMKDRIWMHDLIEEMGEKIANPENKPGKSTRLWNPDDVRRALIDNTGTKKIKGIHLEWYVEDEMYLNAKSFSKMKNLRYFYSSEDIKWSGNIDYLSNELRWLQWDSCPIKSFPLNFHPQKLVMLDISYSPHITRLWDGRKNLPNLKYMDLRGCESLKELPDFSGIPNLINLRLSYCESLVEIHNSVGFLDKLEVLDLACCTGIQEFPKITGKMDSLRKLSLSFTGVKELHPSIGNLSGLEELRLEGCKHLTILPCSIYDLQNLEILHVGCSKLDTFPKKASILHGDSGSLVFPKLRVCCISECNFSIADFIGNLDCLETLNNLDLSYNNFVTLPALCKFVHLEYISLSRCKRLREIPELPPNVLKVNAGYCESLEGFLMLPKSTLNMVQMNLGQCYRFSQCLGNEKMLLDNQDSRFSLVFPCCEVPKWFQYCSKEVFATENSMSETCAISFEIPNKLKLENTGLAVCSVSVGLDRLRADLYINGVHIQRYYDNLELPSDHMCLAYIPLSDEIKGKLLGGWPYKCRVEFECREMRSCGVHLVCQPPNEY